MRTITTAFLTIIYLTVNAQLFVETGVNIQMLTFKSGQSPAIVKIYEQEVFTYGEPISNFPKRVFTFSGVPMINLGYRIPFSGFDMTLNFGTSQDFQKSFEFERKKFMVFFHYKQPIAKKLAIRLTKNFGWLVLGFDESIDNKSVASSITHSNLSPEIREQIANLSDINLLSKSKISNSLESKFVVGVSQVSKDNHFQISALTLFGENGGAFVANLELKLKFSFGKLNQ